MGVRGDADDQRHGGGYDVGGGERAPVPHVAAQGDATGFRFGHRPAARPARERHERAARARLGRIGELRGAAHELTATRSSGANDRTPRPRPLFGSTATEAASRRERTPSFSKHDDRWLLTVLSDRYSSRAMRPFV